jgi:hypothetical protein
VVDEPDVAIESAPVVVFAKYGLVDLGQQLPDSGYVKLDGGRASHIVIEVVLEFLGRMWSTVRQD